MMPSECFLPLFLLNGLLICVRLDYLVNVCGYKVEQARRTLGLRGETQADMTDAVKMLQAKHTGRR